MHNAHCNHKKQGIAHTLITYMFICIPHRCTGRQLALTENYMQAVKQVGQEQALCDHQKHKMLYRIYNNVQYKHALLQNSVKTMSSIVGAGRLGCFLLLVPSKLGPVFCSNRAGICNTLPVHANNVAHHIQHKNQLQNFQQ